MKDILANITSDQAVHILKVLWEKRSDVREIIVKEAERLLGPVDPDEIGKNKKGTSSLQAKWMSLSK